MCRTQWIDPLDRRREVVFSIWTLDSFKRTGKRAVWFRSKGLSAAPARFAIHGHRGYREAGSGCKDPAGGARQRAAWRWGRQGAGCLCFDPEFGRGFAALAVGVECVDV